MKHAVLAAAALAALARPAAACEPAYTCADEWCHAGTVTVIEASLSGLQSNNGGDEATVNITAIHGAAEGVSLGSHVLLSDAYTLSSYDIGKTLLMSLDDQHRIQYTNDTEYLTQSGCFDSTATPATAADVMLSPSCHDTLDPDHERDHPPSCPTGMACDAGGKSGSLLVVAALGLVVRRRRRAR